MKLVRPVLMCCYALCVVYATSKPTKDSRIHHERPLSSHEHNDEDHEYDHDAFLGEEEAKTFDQLPPDESQRRLGIIVDRIDEDKDGLVTEAELNEWIKKAQKKYIYDNVDRQWKDYDTNGDNIISWDEYKNVTYGTYLENPTEEEGYDYKKQMARDEKRFKAADTNADNEADREEFTAFLHPEDFDHMKHTVVQETMEDLDKNLDGFIDLEEYIGDMYKGDEEDHGEPAWVTTEREQFNEFRDKDKDGKMDLEETKDWILPNNYDHALSEAKHLVSESDADKDGKLTKEEILNKFDLFVGSQATDYGEALNKHDEF